jgi:tetrapyrrole methylase family protein/MazG family protein
MSSTLPPRLTIVGLGPGRWEALTFEAATLLQQADSLYLCSPVDLSLDSILSHCPGLTVRPLAAYHHSSPAPTETYDRILTEIQTALECEPSVIYGVPGSPFIGEPTVPLLLALCRELGIESRIIDGLSPLQTALAAVGCVDTRWLQVLDAEYIALLGSENAVGETAEPSTTLPWRAPLPVAPLLISNLHDRSMTVPITRWLQRFYPPRHAIHILRINGSAACPAQTLPLDQLTGLTDIDRHTVLYIPPLTDIENARTFTGIMQLTRRLRGPGGCPWDREQTQESLKPYLLEETYEVLDALDAGDPALIAEEFGDLLYQITINAQVAAEHGAYTIEDVIENVITKLVGRHPHVFGDVELTSAQDVRHAWESFKQRQKPKRSSVLEGIPRGLPALPQSNLMQKRAASIGFVWPGIDEVIAKVKEELEEVRREITACAPAQRQREELGDLLFALVGIARQQRIDPEEALRLANHKFAERFQFVERHAAAAAKTIRDLSAEELDTIWTEAKLWADAPHGDHDTPPPEH